MGAWFRRRTFAELQRRRPDRALRGVSATVASMVEGMRRLYYDVALEELFAEWEGGKVQPLSTLSSGYQSMLALAADLAFRACALNPQLFEWAPTLAQGVVLIDEVDLYLHPRWQRRVLGSLRRTFPHLQFVCTTHSPQVLAAADPAWIRVLEEGAIRQGVDRSRGLDSNTLLQEVFGVPERPAETLQEIGLAREQIAQGQLPAATR
jgi:predicted ATP-binding protein involved in virulence